MIIKGGSIKMTQADEHFINTCKEILEHGYSSEGTGVRTRWERG